MGTPPSIYDLYDGDLWEPGRDVQLSIWTRPNILGYSTGASIPSAYLTSDGDFPIIDDIRYAFPGSTTIEFDYTPDPFARLTPVFIREDSWIGPETSGRTFESTVTVTNGATLTFDGGETFSEIGFMEGLVVEAGATVQINDGVTLKFGSDAQLVVHGTLDSFGNADGITLAPLPAVPPPPPCEEIVCATDDGTWGGVVYQPGSTGMLRNTTVTGVVGAPGKTLFVNNADVTLQGVTLQDGAGDGLFVVGTHADVTMEPTAIRDPEILRHAHRSVVSASGADVTLDEAFIQDSGSVGVYTNDGRVLMRKTRVINSGQQGARAYGQNGRIVLGLTGSGNQVNDQNNLISNSFNASLRVDFGGIIYGGAGRDVFGENYRNNWIRLDSSNPNQRHAWVNGGDVIAECSYWDLSTGPDPSKVFISGSNGGAFDGSPYLFNPPAISTTCGVASSTGGGGSAARHAGIESGARGSSARGGEGPSPIAGEAGPPAGMDARRWYAIVESRENEDAGVGIAYAMEAIEKAATPSNLRRAYEVAGQLGSETTHRGLEALLVERSRLTEQGRTMGPGQTAGQRGLALEALALVYYGSGRAEEARSTTSTLLSEFAETPHARRGWLTRFALARDAGDIASAEAALAAVEARWPDYETDVLRAALVATRTQTTEEGRQGVQPAEGVRQVASSAAQSESEAGLPETTELGAPYPNPTAAGVTVPLALATDAEVTLALLNTLGQRVRALAPRAEVAGQHAYEIATAGLAPGVYLVQATVTTRSGSVRHTRRLTVLR
ncbi:MAG: T9SS type A sorting domain-containing protein [Bacteroidota bacterium]